MTVKRFENKPCYIFLACKEENYDRIKELWTKDKLVGWRTLSPLRLEVDQNRYCYGEFYSDTLFFKKIEIFMLKNSLTVGPKGDFLKLSKHFNLNYYETSKFVLEVKGLTNE
ncbi:MAG: hypothetical protein DWQ19_11195 [Crenarchaeota archaeon]|nr:MAG: hypothetical protein DWQ19_11195 [Thermoproteota archaeon]